MLLAGFLFVLGGVAALALLAFLFLTDVGRAILAIIVLLLMLAVLALIAIFGWPLLQGFLRDDGVREAMSWLGGAFLIGFPVWVVWVEVSDRREAKRRGMTYAEFHKQKYPQAPRYSPPPKYPPPPNFLNR